MPDDSEPASRDETLADIADRIVHVARLLTARGFADTTIVPLSPLEALVVRHIDRHPGITSSHVAANLELRASNTSTILRGLVEKGMVARTEDPSDRRAAHFTLTADAHVSIARLRAEWSGKLGAALPATVDLDGALEVLTALENELG